MTLESWKVHDAAEKIGKLCVGGDWACANGDLEGLRYVAQQLAVYLPEPMHCELVALAEACACDPNHAVELWGGLKIRVQRSSC